MRSTLLALLTLAGCVEHGLAEPETYDSRPVDMVYRVKVTRLYEIDCSAIFNFTEGAATVDLMRRPDGRLIMSSASAYLPFYGPIEGIESRDGRVLERLERPANQPDSFRAIEIEGTLTPDMINLVIAVESVEPLRDEILLCRRAVRVVGKPRQLLDTTSIDGRYRLVVTPRGVSCDGTEPPPGKPLGAAWADIDPFRPDRASFRFLTGRLAFDFTVPEPDGSVDWSGAAFLLDDGGFTEIEGKLRGTLRPDKVSLTIMTRRLDYPEGCWEYADLDGAKHLPSLESRTGEYRAHVRVEDSCAGDGDGETDMVVTLIEQDDGSLWLFENKYRTELSASGNALNADIPTGIDGVTYRYSGTLNPPNLNYTATYEDTRPDSACRYRAEVAAQKRFVFPPR